MCHHFRCDKLAQLQWWRGRKYALMADLSLLLTRKLQGAEESLCGVVCHHNDGVGVWQMTYKTVVGDARVREYEQHRRYGIEPAVWAVLLQCGEAHRVDYHSVDSHGEDLLAQFDVRQYIPQKWKYNGRKRN